MTVKKKKVPKGMAVQESFGGGGQMKFNSGEGKKTTKKIGKKNKKKPAKKGSGKLTSFGIKLPGISTLTDFGKKKKRKRS